LDTAATPPRPAGRRRRDAAEHARVLGDDLLCAFGIFWIHGGAPCNLSATAQPIEVVVITTFDGASTQLRSSGVLTMSIGGAVAVTCRGNQELE
jgi:hypothetical protein